MMGSEEVTSAYCQAVLLGQLLGCSTQSALMIHQEELLPALGATALPVLLPAEGNAG